MTLDSKNLTLAAQGRFFRIAARDGHTLKSLSVESGIPYETVRSYAGNKGAHAEMPLSALRALARVPDLNPDTLSFLLDGTGRCVSDECGEDLDPSALAANCVEFTGVYTAARDPKSECGVDIGPGEEKRIRSSARKLRVAA